MSGPIVRQYGVPNWDEIFGKKDEKSGEAESTAKETPPTAEKAQKKADERKE